MEMQMLWLSCVMIAILVTVGQVQSDTKAILQKAWGNDPLVCSPVLLWCDVCPSQTPGLQSIGGWDLRSTILDDHKGLSRNSTTSMMMKVTNQLRNCTHGMRYGIAQPFVTPEVGAHDPALQNNAPKIDNRPSPWSGTWNSDAVYHTCL